MLPKLRSCKQIKAFLVYLEIIPFFCIISGMLEEKEEIEKLHVKTKQPDRMRRKKSNPCACYISKALII
jgi:hypothetical protein